MIDSRIVAAVKRLLILIGILAATSTLFAQSNFSAGEPLVFQADHDGAQTQWYSLFIDGAYVTHVGMNGNVNGVVSIRLAGGLAAGSHVAMLQACGSSSCENSDALIFTVDPARGLSVKPPPPRNLHFIK